MGDIRLTSNGFSPIALYARNGPVCATDLLSEVSAYFGGLSSRLDFGDRPYTADMADALKASVLIVDDEREHAQVMCEALERVGCRCEVTYSLEEARGKLSKKEFDVIVTDLMMDGRADGLEVLRESKGVYPPAAGGAGDGRARGYSDLQTRRCRRGRMTTSKSLWILITSGHRSVGLPRRLSWPSRTRCSRA